MYFSRVRVRPDFYKDPQYKQLAAGQAYQTHQLLWKLFPAQQQRAFLYREEIAREQFGYIGGARGEPVYYLVSSTKPSSSVSFFDTETRPYEPKLLDGESLRFELRANPVVARNGKKHDIVMDTQKTFLISLCEEFSLQSHLSGNTVKQEYKTVLLTHGGQALDNRLTALLENDCRYAERLEQTLTLQDKLEWALKAVIDNALAKWMEDQGKRNGFAIAQDKYETPKLQNTAYQWHAIHKNGAKDKKSGFSSVDFTGDLIITDVDKFKTALFNGIGRSKAFGCGLMLVKRI